MGPRPHERDELLREAVRGLVNRGCFFWGSTGRDRERQGETGRGRERQGETGRDRERQGETGRDRERRGDRDSE